MNIQIVVSHRAEYSQPAPVNAQLLFDLAPHLAGIATFAVHQDAWFPSIWNVTHIESGLAVVHSKPTKMQAIKNAKHILANKTVGDVMRGMRKSKETLA